MWNLSSRTTLDPTVTKGARAASLKSHLGQSPPRRGMLKQYA